VDFVAGDYSTQLSLSAANAVSEAATKLTNFLGPNVDIWADFHAVFSVKIFRGVADLHTGHLCPFLQ
jgi:hypothetical protein